MGLVAVEHCTAHQAEQAAVWHQLRDQRDQLQASVQPRTDLGLLRPEEPPSLQPLLEAKQALLQQRQALEQEMIVLCTKYADFPLGAEHPHLTTLRYDLEGVQHPLHGREGHRRLLEAGVEFHLRLPHVLKEQEQAQLQAGAGIRQGHRLAGSARRSMGLRDPQLPNWKKRAQRYRDPFRTRGAQAVQEARIAQEGSSHETAGGVRAAASNPLAPE